MPRPSRTVIRIPCAPPPPKLVSIRTSYLEPEVVTQVQMETAYLLRMHALEAMRIAMEATIRISDAVKRGATQEDGRFEWDDEKATFFFSRD